jgi:uncharacterized protein
MNSDLSNGIIKSKRPLFMPDFTAKNILDVDFKKIKSLGVKHIFIDLDLTLRKKMSRKLEPQVNEYLIRSIKELGFTSISIASNNMLNLQKYGIPISAKIYQPYWKGTWLIRKPNLVFYRRMITDKNAEPAECVMIGDKLRADIFGGNRAGMYTILVMPYGSDYWYDKILLTRRRERRSLQEFIPIKLRLKSKKK